LDVLSAQNAFTESHQVLVKVNGDVPRLWQEMTGAGILANPIRPPRETTLGFRFGIAEVTRLGYAASEVEEAALLAAGMINGTLAAKDAKVRIRELAMRPRAMKFCFEEPSP
jgi:glycine/serine hydroxymethyltransferase